MSSFNFLIHRINREIAARLPYQGRVVDLGCGMAPYRDLILQRADSYLGLDWPHTLHEQQRVDLFANVAAALPLEPGCADTVVAFQVMEHLPTPQTFLAECFRILRPGGQIFLTVPFMWHVHEEPHDYYRYTRYGLRFLLEQAGFAEVRVEENTGFWQMWALKWNYHTRRLARGPLQLLFAPTWWLGQTLAPLLDRYDRHPQETASYTVAARKP